ncbi:Sterol 3-beta-glucosyltransferase [Savitreella phatthalungensis]
MPRRMRQSFYDQCVVDSSEEDLAKPSYKHDNKDSSYLDFVHRSPSIDENDESSAHRHAERTPSEGSSMVARIADDNSEPAPVVEKPEDDVDEMEFLAEGQARADEDSYDQAKTGQHPIDSTNGPLEATEMSTEDLHDVVLAEQKHDVDPVNEQSRQALEIQVRQLFDLPESEQLLEAYSAWLLKSVLLQGRLFLTSTQLCYYAFISHTAESTIKSGYLVKVSEGTGRTHRYYFSLQDHMLSYYQDPGERLFEQGNINLKDAIEALPSVKHSTVDGYAFLLRTRLRDYIFKTETASAANEWIKIIQKVIFRLNTNGDAVKVTIPFSAILDIEQTHDLTFVDTLKVRLAEEDGSFELSEYNFALFEYMDMALASLKKRVAETDARRLNNASVRDTSVEAPGFYRRPGELANLARGDNGGSDADGDSNFEQTIAKFVKQHQRRRSAASRAVSSVASIGQGLKAAASSATSTVSKTLLGVFKTAEDEEVAAEVAAQAFREHFGLDDNEVLLKSYSVFYFSTVPLAGELFVSDRHLCFESTTAGTKTRIVVKTSELDSAKKEKAFRFGFSGLQVSVRAHEDISFEFSQVSDRDQCLEFIDGAISYWPKLEHEAKEEQERQLKLHKQHAAEHESIEQACEAFGSTLQSDSMPPLESVVNVPPIIFDSPSASMVAFKPRKQLHITCLTIGSRGDVQPYVALCKGLIKDGQKARIATHEEFREFVESHGIEFAPIDGDPSELMALCVEYGMFTYSFLREASTKFRTWIDDLLNSSWRACQGTDMLIESPSAMGGIHIAESLGIPYYRAFTMPWVKTRVYPHAFAVPERNMGGNYNAFTYSAFDTLFWKAISGQVNRWRRKTLNLPSTNFDKLAQHKVPFLYNFSPSVVPPANDWHEWVRVTGYWYLDNPDGNDWKPTEEITNFIERARKDGKKLAYIGFGSIVVSKPEALTKAVIAAVNEADVRCILVKGWSDRGSKGKSDDDDKEKQAKEDKKTDYGDNILSLESIPHDWLFPQIDVACHHGGAGSLGASLRAGVPTIVKPFFGDQYFFGDRVADLGVGVCLKKLTTSSLVKALKRCVEDELTIERAQKIGESLRQEDGVATAIECIYRDLVYAQSLIKYPQRRKGGSPNESRPVSSNASSGQGTSDESWVDVDGSRSTQQRSDTTDEHDDADLYDTHKDEDGKSFSLLKGLRDLKLPHPLGDSKNSSSYGLGGLNPFKWGSSS